MRVGLGPLKHRTVLAMMLCHPDRELTSEELIDAVWEGRPPSSAASNPAVLHRRAAPGAGCGDLATRTVLVEALTLRRDRPFADRTDAENGDPPTPDTDRGWEDRTEVIG